MSQVFISGATGYLGRPLTRSLISAGFDVRALTRPRSMGKLPIGCTPVPGNALDAGSFVDAVPAGSTFVHLTGVSHPSPAKAAEFRSIDQTAFEASLEAAQVAKARHFVYVSVAQPAPVMRAYVEVRRECERRLEESGLNATILRPWYILGPGHRWPYLLLLFYKIAENVPAWRASAIRLGLVSHRQMMAALLHAIHTPGEGIAVLDVAAIRAASFGEASASQALLSSPRRSPTPSA